MEKETQISAFVSRATWELLERQARATGVKKGPAARKTLRRTTMSTSKRTALLGFFMASLAAPAMAAEGEGAAAAVAPEKPSGEPTKMFIGGGIGPALNPRYKVNGKTITFSSRGPRTRYLPSP